MKIKKPKLLPTGKLDADLLKQIFEEYNSPQMQINLENSRFKDSYEDSKKRVKLGFAIGEDAAVIEMKGKNSLVVKTDPITFATEDIGYYVVNVNANDVAAMGATPKWFQATILLPENIATYALAEKICMDIQKSCLELGIFLIGGHTEVTYDLNRPIVIGSMIGEVSNGRYIQSSGGKPGDAIILTKGIPLEGTSIIAREKESSLLKQGISADVVNKSKNLLFTPGISVIKEALLAAQHFQVHAMHDPTEGGLSMGLVELARASDCGFLIEYEKIPILAEGKKLCELFDLNPLQTISSGSLLIVVNESDSEKLVNLLNEEGIVARKIGNLTSDKAYLLSCDGKNEEILYSEKDEITKIFDD
jgi:hydrogenase maturation factor